VGDLSPTYIPVEIAGSHQQKKATTENKFSDRKSSIYVYSISCFTNVQWSHQLLFDKEEVSYSIAMYLVLSLT
jgi:hypothetical protein